MASAPLLVILSGGIGSGKSTVGQMLAARGAEVVDADALGHRVLERDGEAYDSVAARWPTAVVGEQIDRARLAAIVFADPTELAALEKITHPHIAARIARAVASSPRDIVVVELPLLRLPLGPGWLRLVVTAPTDLRRRRLLARGHDDGDIARRIASQPGDEEWSAVADLVVDNSGSRDDLAREVDRVWAELQAIRDR